MNVESTIGGQTGPVILRAGFRPFFLAAAGWAVLAMVLYVALLSGVPVIAPAFSLVDWHIHEFLFGYVGAVVAGFALTVMPARNGSHPLVGSRLAALLAVWLAGRIVIAWDSGLGAPFIAAVDLAFPLLLMAAVGRNVAVLALIGLFLLANAGFHYETAMSGEADHSVRAGIAVVLTLIVIVGGRIIPAVTRDWMKAHGDPDLPSPFDVFDGVAIAMSAVALGFWATAPYAPTSALLLAFAALLNFARVARWHGGHTQGEGLIAILHVAYAFVPLGLAAMALAAFDPLLMPPSAAMHLLTVGALAIMTLAVMTRTSLEQTGGPLHADRFILALFVSMTLSMLARVAYALEPAYFLLMASAALWVVTFVMFLCRFGFLAFARL